MTSTPMIDVTHQRDPATHETIDATRGSADTRYATRETIDVTRESGDARYASAVRRDTLDAIVIVVPPDEYAAELRRNAPKRVRSDLRVPLFLFVGLPAIALVGVVIGYVLTAL